MLIKNSYELALEIAFSNKIYAYDAYVIAVAKQHKSGLITLDKKMGEIARKNGIRVEGV